MSFQELAGLKLRFEHYLNGDDYTFIGHDHLNLLQK